MIKTKVLRPPRVAAASVYCHAVRGRAHRLCLCSSSGGCEKGKRSNIPRGVVGGGGGNSHIQTRLSCEHICCHMHVFFQFTSGEDVYILQEKKKKLKKCKYMFVPLEVLQRSYEHTRAHTIWSSSNHKGRLSSVADKLPASATFKHLQIHISNLSGISPGTGSSRVHPESREHSSVLFLNAPSG